MQANYFAIFPPIFTFFCALPVFVITCKIGSNLFVYRKHVEVSTLAPSSHYNLGFMLYFLAEEMALTEAIPVSLFTFGVTVGKNITGSYKRN